MLSGTIEKLQLIVAVLTFIVACVGLVFSDSYTPLFGGTEIVFFEEKVKINKLTQLKENVGLIKIKNVGKTSSENLKIIVDFQSVIPKYDVYSEEDITKIEVVGDSLRIALERLSTDSNIKVSTISKDPIAFEMFYIDDSGKHEVKRGVQGRTSKLRDVIWLVLVVGSLLAIVWIYKKASESFLIKVLEGHQNTIQENLRELKDDIGNIEIIVNDSDSGAAPNSFTQRLSDFISR